MNESQHYRTMYHGPAPLMTPSKGFCKRCGQDESLGEASEVPPCHIRGVTCPTYWVSLAVTGRTEPATPAQSPNCPVLPAHQVTQERSMRDGEMQVGRRRRSLKVSES